MQRKEKAADLRKWFLTKSIRKLAVTFSLQLPHESALLRPKSSCIRAFRNPEYAAAKSINDFEGATIVGQLGTFHETVIPQMAGVTQETSMKDFPTMIMALKSKTIDGYIAEKPGAIADCKLNDDLTYVDLVNNDTGFTVDAENVTIAVGVKKGSELTAKINEILGTIDQATRDKLMSDAIDQCEQ